MHYGTNQKFGGPGQDLGGLCPSGPSLKLPLHLLCRRVLDRIFPRTNNVLYTGIDFCTGCAAGTGAFSAAPVESAPMTSFTSLTLMLHLNGSDTYAVWMYRLATMHSVTDRQTARQTHRQHYDASSADHTYIYAAKNGSGQNLQRHALP